MPLYYLLRSTVNPVLSPLPPLFNYRSLPSLRTVRTVSSTSIAASLPYTNRDFHELALQYFSTLEVGSLKGQCMRWME